ncbi:MAG: flagellar biosynthetic protein FliO [Treponema sp.]|nr:flagellar biosynthetic protein FliO [Treponema sp.]
MSTTCIIFSNSLQLRIISYTWRGKLKSPAGISRFLAAIFALCLFFPLATGIFAQDEAVPAVEVPAADPIIEAERALSLGNNGAEIAAPPSGISAWSILRVLLTLAVVAAAIYGLVFIIKRVSRGRTAQDPFLKILASTPLGVNRSVHIVSVGSQAWLVGSAESGVSLISEVEDKDILNAMLLEDSRRSASAANPGGSGIPDFKALLRRLGVPADSGAPPGPENIRKRGERLKGIQ